MQLYPSAITTANVLLVVLVCVVQVVLVVVDFVVLEDLVDLVNHEVVLGHLVLAVQPYLIEL